MISIRITSIQEDKLVRLTMLIEMLMKVESIFMLMSLGQMMVLDGISMSTRDITPYLVHLYGSQSLRVRNTNQVQQLFRLQLQVDRLPLIVLIVAIYWICLESRNSVFIMKLKGRHKIQESGKTEVLL